MGLNYALLRKNAAAQAGFGFRERFTGKSGKEQRKTISLPDQTLMIIAAKRGISIGVVAFCTNNEEIVGKVVEITKRGVRLDGRPQYYDPRYLELTTDE